MTDDTPSQDERLAAWLAAYESAQNDGSPPPVEEDLTVEQRHRLHRGIAGLNLARMLRTRPTPPSENGLPWACLGRFQLRRELGRGGCGIVYLAYDPALNREVALKIPRAEVAVTPELRERFQREAQAAASLDHPNLVPVFESGEAGPVCYIASAYCPGVNLAEWLKEHDGPVPVPAAAELIATLAGAVQHAHDRGVLHRDLKPSNVLLSRRASGPLAPDEEQASRLLYGSEPKITDFGLAKFLLEGTKPGQTYSGAIVGTPNYMAPEQAAGKDRNVGRAADVYALGAILYEMLTGRPPFLGETDLDTLRRAQNEEPLPPRRLRPGLSRDINTICLKCLEKEPPRRYASAALLADDLRRFVMGQPIRARPPGIVGRAVRWGRRNPALAAASLLAAAALVLALVLGVGYGFARQEALAAEQLRGEQTQTKAALAKAAEASARLALERGMTLSQQGDTSRGFLWVARSLALTPADEPELEHAVRANLAGWRRQLQPLRQVIAHADGVVCLALTPDGRTDASGSLDGTARLWDAVTGRVLHTLPRHPHDIEALAFTPDGATLVTSCGGRCRFWKVNTGQPTGLATSDPLSIYHLAFSPDGRTFAAGGALGHARIRRTDTGQPLGSPLKHKSRWNCAVEFSVDGRHLVTVGDDSGAIRRDAQTGERLNVAGRFEGHFMRLLVCRDGRSLLLADATGVARRWEVQTGAALGPPLPHPGAVTCLAESPDGRMIVTGCEDGSARLWRADTSTALGQPLRHTMAVTSVAFSSDGRLVATASRDGTARLWDVTTNRPASPPLPHRDRVVQVAFASLSTTLVTASLDGTVRFWDIASEPLSLALKHQGPIEAAIFRPDGKVVATGSSDQIVRLWDAATGQPHATPLHHSTRVLALAFSPDGKTVGVGARVGARLWQPETGRTFDLPMAICEAVFSVAFSPDGRFFATGGGDNMVHRWRVATGEPLLPMLNHRHAVRSLAFSPDGKWLASGDRGGTVQVCDAESGRFLATLSGHRDAVYSLAFSHDGRMLVAGSHDTTARMWEVPSGKPVCPPLAHEGRVLALALDPESRWLVTASADGRARFWDVNTGQLVGPTIPHPGPVQSVAFRPDGKVLATACVDGAVRLWDVGTGKPFGMPLPHDGPVERVVFSPDGRTLLTAGRDNTARLWRPASPVGGGVERITAWAEVMTGQTLDAEGGVRVLDAAEWERRRRTLEELGGAP